MNTNIKIQDKPVKSMTIKEAAEEMGKSQQFVRIGIQRGRLTFGTAEILTGNKYTYYISPPLFFQYIGKPLPNKYKEIEEKEITGKYKVITDPAMARTMSWRDRYEIT